MGQGPRKWTQINQGQLEEYVSWWHYLSFDDLNSLRSCMTQKRQRTTRLIWNCNRYLLQLFITSIVVIAILIVIINIFTTYFVISVITTFSDAIIMIENRTCKSTIARQAAVTPLAMEVGRWSASRKIVINESGGESIEFSNLSRAESWNGD